MDKHETLDLENANYIIIKNLNSKSCETTTHFKDDAGKLIPAIIRILLKFCEKQGLSEHEAKEFLILMTLHNNEMLKIRSETYGQ